MSHTHFLKVWVVTEAPEDAASFQLSSTGCEKQETTPGTLITGVCWKDAQAPELKRYWETRVIWGLAVTSSVADHVVSCLWFLCSFLNICFLKIWPATRPLTAEKMLSIRCGSKTHPVNIETYLYTFSLSSWRHVPHFLSSDPQERSSESLTKFSSQAMVRVY